MTFPLIWLSNSMGNEQIQLSFSLKGHFRGGGKAILEHQCFSGPANVLSSCFQSLYSSLALQWLVFLLQYLNLPGTSILVIIVMVNQWSNIFALFWGYLLPWKGHSPERQLMELQHLFFLLFSWNCLSWRAFLVEKWWKGGTLSPWARTAKLWSCCFWHTSVGIPDADQGGQGHFRPKWWEIQETEFISCRSFVYGEIKAATLISE